MAWIRRVGMCVKRTLRGRIAGDKKKLRLVFLKCPFTKPSLMLRTEVWFLAAVISVTLIN
jgi:hypothetical protein